MVACRRGLAHVDGRSVVNRAAMQMRSQDSPEAIAVGVASPALRVVQVPRLVGCEPHTGDVGGCGSSLRAGKHGAPRAARRQEYRRDAPHLLKENVDLHLLVLRESERNEERRGRSSAQLEDAQAALWHARLLGAAELARVDDLRRDLALMEHRAREVAEAAELPPPSIAVVGGDPAPSSAAPEAPEEEDASAAAALAGSELVAERRRLGEARAEVRSAESRAAAAAEEARRLVGAEAPEDAEEVEDAEAERWQGLCAAARSELRRIEAELRDAEAEVEAARHGAARLEAEALGMERAAAQRDAEVAEAEARLEALAAAEASEQRARHRAEASLAAEADAAERDSERLRPPPPSRRRARSAPPPPAGARTERPRGISPQRAERERERVARLLKRERESDPLGAQRAHVFGAWSSAPRPEWRRRQQGH